MEIRIKEIKHKKADLQAFVAISMLSSGFGQTWGGDILCDWLKKNRDHVGSVFCSFNEVYLEFRADKESRLEAYRLIKLKDKIGDYWQWKKTSDGKTLLHISWD